MAKRPTFLLDLDDTIVEWTEAACRLQGKTIDDFRELVRTTKDVDQFEIVERLAPTPGKFWDRFDEVSSWWWSRLSPLPWLPRIAELINQYDSVILTAVSLDGPAGSVVDGKIRWAKRFMPRRMYSKLIFCPSDLKHMFCRHGAVLLDDRHKTIEDWNATAELYGYDSEAVLFPRFNPETGEDPTDRQIASVFDRVEQFLKDRTE